MSSMDSSQLLNPKNDFVFKKIFTAHSRLKGAISIHLRNFDLFKDTEQQQKQALWRFEMRDGLQPDIKLGDDL